MKPIGASQRSGTYRATLIRSFPRLFPRPAQRATLLLTTSSHCLPWSQVLLSRDTLPYLTLSYASLSFESDVSRLTLISHQQCHQLDTSSPTSCPLPPRDSHSLSGPVFLIGKTYGGCTSRRFPVCAVAVLALSPPCTESSLQCRSREYAFSPLHIHHAT